MTHRTTKGATRALAAIPGIALVAAGLATAGSVGAATAAPVAPDDTAPFASVGASEAAYINYVAPQFESAYSVDKTVGKTRALSTTALQRALAKARAVDRKNAGGNPVAAKQLAALEAEALRTNASPAQVKRWRYKQAPSTQTAKLLTILVEFNPTANDDFTGVHVPTSWGAEDCKLGSVQNGPLHNQIPNPALAPYKDNNTMWVPNFSPAHYNSLLYSRAGIRQRVRMDLKGPDGKPGISIFEKTMRNYYMENSHGAYLVSGSATPWVKVPHSEGWYGASVCRQQPDGTWKAGAVQDMTGHPNNPLGPGQLALDAVTALAQAQPNFPWAQYDVEDQGDIDGDGNYNEPDGIIDHVVLVHAGEDKSGDGGAQGTYAIWAHSSAVPGGKTVPGTSLKVSNYVVQMENAGVGVFAHEYGHDLGLPDLYDTGDSADSDVDFWDLMSSGSHSGPIFQSMPTHMGIWDKWVLGWADPKILPVNTPIASYKVSQSSRPMVGTEDGLKVNLPDKRAVLATPHSGTQMWYSSSDQAWADVKLVRSVQVPANGKFWMWNNYSIEEDWDFGFVEVSTDGGATWKQQKVYTADGSLVSTDDGYADPNHRLADYGGLKYGLTGMTDGWRHDYVDLTAYAGQNIKLRLRYATDAGFEDTGWFVDDLALTSGSQTLWSDDAEGTATNGWTPVTGTFESTSGAGWRKDNGILVQKQYYLVEWRTFDGFDEGLKYAYDTTYSVDGAWKVEKIKYNAPGMLVWYRDTAYGTQNWVGSNLTNLPSGGAKGGLLIVDSHFEPLRRTGAAAAIDPTTLKNLPSRPQSSNAAFTLQPTYPFKECVVDANVKEYCNTHAAQPGVQIFSDNKGWVPGIEIRGSSLYWRDADASVVVPSKGNAPYTTRVVDANGKPLKSLYGVDLGFTVLGDGNPASSGVGNNTYIRLWKTQLQNKIGIIQVRPMKVS